MELKSALYVGHLAHARRAPSRHTFSYRVYMLYLDLSELDRLGAARLLGRGRLGGLSFRGSDYRGKGRRPILETIQSDVLRATGQTLDGPVRMLTHIRSFGYVFNPVTFYYCFQADGTTLQAVVAEITNTPWHERHAYVVPAQDQARGHSFDKAFHVSPFFPMSQRYHWNLSRPGEVLTVEMRSDEDGKQVFRASLRLKRRPLTRSNLLRAALTHPLMTWKVHTAIYWQAFRLWCKGTPFVVHPSRTDSPTEEA